MVAGEKHDCTFVTHKNEKQLRCAGTGAESLGLRNPHISYVVHQISTWNW